MKSAERTRRRKEETEGTRRKRVLYVVAGCGVERAFAHAMGKRVYAYACLSRRMHACMAVPLLVAG